MEDSQYSGACHLAKVGLWKAEIADAVGYGQAWETAVENCLKQLLERIAARRGVDLKVGYVAELAYVSVMVAHGDQISTFHIFEIAAPLHNQMLRLVVGEA